MAYLDVNGHPTWLTVGESTGPTVLLLHGGLSNGDAMLDTVGGPLSAQFRTATFDRRGHGRTADTEEAFHYDTMADETVAVIEHLGAPVHIVGWSDGGIIGLLLALRRPELLDRLVVIGTNFHYSGVRGLEMDDDDPAFQMIAESYAERTPDGADHFAVVASKSLAMFAAEPTLTVDDLATVTIPTLVMVGDDDLIELSHTCAMYEAIPDAQLAIVPAASHALPLEHPEATARLISEFLTSDLPPATFMPVRRRH